MMHQVAIRGRCSGISRARTGFHRIDKSEWRISWHGLFCAIILTFIVLWFLYVRVSNA